MTGQIESPTRHEGSASQPRKLHIRVVDESKGGKPVDVTLPIGLVRFGLKMARTFSPELEDVDIDWGEILAAIDSGERGHIVHVEDEAERRTVDVSLE